MSETPAEAIARLRALLARCRRALRLQDRRKDLPALLAEIERILGPE